MEKLIVKNFGPIKEAEIDLTKYVVFIGDTSTGKSVLAKLIAIFRDFIPSFKNDIEDLDFTQQLAFQKQLKLYNIDFDFQSTQIIYLSNKLEIVFENKKVAVLKNSLEKTKPQDLKTFFVENRLYSNEEMWEIFSRIGFKSSSIYFPAERILTSLIGSSISGLWAHDVALPACFKNFAAKYEIAKQNIKNFDFSDFGFEYNYDGTEEKINYQGNEIHLSQASSGIQSLLPLLLVLNHELKPDTIFFPYINLLMEEPELNLFPVKQKVLLEYVIKKLCAVNILTRFDTKLVITTHSPYILSVLDTLMLAKNTFNEHPELKEEINAIISEDKWIDYDDISVYEVKNDGTIKSIKNEEFRSIDTNAIDGVSDIISEEFDKLTELRYAQ